MSEAMVEKDRLVRRRNAILCSVPGSGFHDKDSAAPQNQGLPKLDAHIVVFAGPFEYTLVGASAEAAQKAFADYAAKHKPEEAEDMHWRGLAKVAAEYAAEKCEGGALVVRAQQWNAAQEVLALSGVGVTSTDDKPFPADDPILKVLQG